MQLPRQSSPAPWRECSIGSVRRTPVILLAVVAALLLPASALAAPVLVLGHHGRVTRRQDPYLQGPAITPPPAMTRARAATADANAIPAARTPTPGTKKKKKKKKKKPVTFGSVLGGLERAGRITAAQDHQALGAFNAALATEKRLSGTRRDELADVTSTVHDIAAAHDLTPSRLPAIEATLDANRRWWSSGTLLAYGDRVQFQGSELEWEYYPGQGIQLQVLGSFGEANGLYQAGKDAQMEQLLAELIPLASQRGGGLTWEYYFSFDGGSPPWTSAMSQATALQALAHAYQATDDDDYLQVAASALGVFGHGPPAGVAVHTARGLRFLQYSFAPSERILNAFLQTLIGLDEYAQVSGNPTAAQLFEQGNAEAEAEVPGYNTGAWSLYVPGEEDDLSYHELVTGFLAQLCTLTGAPVYCATASDFTTDLKTPPALAAVTARTRAKRPFSLRFTLSKISHVGVTIRRGTRVRFATSATFPHGTDSVAVGKLAAGSYSVTLTATDLAGNYTRDPPATLTVGR
jgi:hypothetical protein